MSPIINFATLIGAVKRLLIDILGTIDRIAWFPGKYFLGRDGGPPRKEVTIDLK
jgi:hypothetical protein